MPVICLRESCGKRHQLSEKLSWEGLHTKKHTKAERQCVTACVNVGGGEAETEKMLQGD